MSSNSENRDERRNGTIQNLNVLICNVMSLEWGTEGWMKPKREVGVGYRNCAEKNSQ